MIKASVLDDVVHQTDQQDFSAGKNAEQWRADLGLPELLLGYAHSIALCWALCRRTAALALLPCSSLEHLAGTPRRTVAESL